MRRVLYVLVPLLLLVGCEEGLGPIGTEPAGLTVVEGADQTGTVGAALEEPVVVEVTGPDGSGLAGVPVAWSASGDGTVSGSVTTDAEGRASGEWTLGTAAGEQTLEVTVADVEAATVTATAEAGPAAAVGAESGDEQEAATGAALADPLVVRVTDAYGNGVAGVEVAWATSSGSADPAAGTTDADGLAETVWTLGDAEGEATMTATAGEAGSVEFTATATGVAATCEGETSVGATEGGTLTDACEDEDGRYYRAYTLDLAAQTAVEFEVESAAFSPRVSVRNASGTVVPELSGGAGLGVLVAGSYDVVVSTSAEDAGMGGDYTLSLTESVADADACGDQAFLTVGATVDAAFTAGDCQDDIGIPEQRLDTYPVRLDVGSTYRVTVETTGETGLSVWAYDSEDARWEMFEHRRRLDAGTFTATYTVSSSSYQYIYPVGVPGIDYTVTLEEVTDHDPCAAVDQYQIGVWLTGRFTDDDCGADLQPKDRFSLTLNESQSFRVEMVTQDSSITPSFYIQSDDRDATVVTTFVGNPGFGRAMLAPGSYTVVPILFTDTAGRGHYEMRSFHDGHAENGCGVHTTVFAMPGTGTSGTIGEADCLDEYEESPNPDYRYDEYLVRADAGVTYTADVTLSGEGSVSVWAADESGSFGLRGGDGTTEPGTVSISHAPPADGWMYFYVLAPAGTSYDVSFREN